MRLSTDALQSRLAAGGAPPAVVWIHGDEPLLVLEAGDAVRGAARQAGWTEREVVQVDRGFKAATLAARLGIPRQRVNYHLRALELHGLVELAGERRHGGIVERLLQATAESFVVSPAAVDGAATEVIVDVHETACTSARDPGPFLDEPAVVSTDESVTVYWTSEPPVGGANCPGNPTSQQVLTLDEPLGDRPLLDGSRWPPVLVGQDD